MDNQELRQASEGQLRAEYKRLMEMEVADGRGERIAESWLDIRNAKILVEAEFRARGLEPRTGLHVRIKNPSESNGNVMVLSPNSLNVKIGELPKEELLAMKERLEAELGRRGEK